MLRMNPASRNAPHGVLLINLGTPGAPRASAIRKWLGQFLADPRVVELPRWLWLPILYLFILPFRPGRLAAKYRSIWGEQGSPLLVISQQQQAQLQAQLDQAAPGIFRVSLGMRYGEPTLQDALMELSEAGAEQLTVLPLYPQYSSTTTASSIEAVVDTLRQFRNIPAIRTIKDYHQHPRYIEALAQSVARFREAHGPGDHLLMSFHGLPQRNADLGDPYPDQCETTARLLADSLGLADDEWSLSYQSRFGKARWLEPATEPRLKILAQSVKVVDVICPGFAADCLETLEEINIGGRELFRSAGGADLRYIPALNANPAHIDCLAALVADSTSARSNGEQSGAVA